MRSGAQGVSSLVSLNTYGHVSIFKMPPDYPEPPRVVRSSEDARAVRQFLLDRESWPRTSKSNTLTEYGKSYLWQFATRAVDRVTSQPLHATTSLESDDFITKLAVGDKTNPGPPDPTAFTSKDDTIQSYRGRGVVFRSINVDPAILPHAVQVEARFDGTNIKPAIIDSPFVLTEAALVEHNSNDETGDNPGNRVITYCTFEEDPTPIETLDRISLRWLLGIS